MKPKCLNYVNNLVSNLLSIVNKKQKKNKKKQKKQKKTKKKKKTICVLEDDINASFYNIQI